MTNNFKIKMNNEGEIYFRTLLADTQENAFYYAEQTYLGTCEAAEVIEFNVEMGEQNV